MTDATDLGSFSADPPGATAAMVVLHGLTGSPASMRPLADHCVAAGYAVRLPLLPGHGTSWTEMNTTRYPQWRDAALAVVREALSEYENVFVVGLSLGGALALEAAIAEPGVQGLFLINPAVRIASPLAPLLPLLSRFIPSLAAIGDDIAKPGTTEHAYERTPLAATSSMHLALIGLRKQLWMVKAPLAVFQSTTDHVVPGDSSEFIWRHVGSTAKHRVILRRSYHVATLDYDAELINSTIVELARQWAQSSRQPIADPS